MSKGFIKQTEEEPRRPGSIHEVDLSRTCFQKIENLKNETPNGFYDDPKYYKVTLTGENASAQRVHQVLSKYLTCTDPKDRSVYRQQIVTCYWELLRGMAPKMTDLSLPMPKRMLMRYGIILPSLFKAEHKEFFSKMIFENKYGEPILYVDEWFKEIASGRMTNSATDEKKQVRAANLTPDQAASAEQSRLMQLQSKNSGKLQSSENMLNMKESERAMIETELRNRVDTLCDHLPIMGLEPHKNAMTETQRKLFSEITDLLHRLSKNDKELSKYLQDYQEAKQTYDNVQSKISMNGGGSGENAQVVASDAEAIKIEFETVRQMAKMTIGRRGNAFPIFTREFYHCTERGTGTRENVIDILDLLLPGDLISITTSLGMETRVFEKHLDVTSLLIDVKSGETKINSIFCTLEFVSIRQILRFQFLLGCIQLLLITFLQSYPILLNPDLV